MTKPTKWHVRPAKTQMSLDIRPVSSESSLCAQWLVKDPSFLHADCEDYDMTERMPRLIWVFAGRTCHFVGFVMRWFIFFPINRFCLNISEDVSFQSKLDDASMKTATDELNENVKDRIDAVQSFRHLVLQEKWLKTPTGMSLHLKTENHFWLSLATNHFITHILGGQS